MSRIAKTPITIPSEVDVTLEGQSVKIKGPKGQLECEVHKLVSVERNDDCLHIKTKKDDTLIDRNFVNAISGTMRANLNNMVIGVTKGYELKLHLVGVGFRANLQGNVLNLTLGFSHPVNFAIPNGVTIKTPSQTEIIIEGIDKQLVGQVAADIRILKPVEPYKGKGVRYSDERVVLKETKKK